MTQKELLYVEDAINHERTLINNVGNYINCLSDDNLREFMEKRKKMHQKNEKDLIEVLEENSNE